MLLLILIIKTVFIYTNSNILQFNINGTREINFYLDETRKFRLSIDLEDTISSISDLLNETELVDSKDSVHKYPGSFFIDSNQQQITCEICFQLYGDDILSLSHKPLNTQYSIVHIMQSQNLISNKQFALELNENKTNQHLFFGGVPSQTLKQYSKGITVSADPSKNEGQREYWGFNVKYLQIQTNTFKLNRTCFLSIDHGSIVSNRNFYEWMKSNTFEEYLNTGECYEKGEYYKSVHCKAEVFSKLPSLWIVLNEKPLEKIEIKFRNVTDSNEVNFVYNPAIDDDDFIFINRNIFYEKIVKFDYDKNEITFYEKGNVVNKTKVKVLVIVSLILNFVFCVYLGTLLINNKLNIF